MNQCPICNYHGTFKNYRGRPNAYCNQCGALERHRLVWLFWQARTNLFDGQPKRMLHFAPEACFRSRLVRLPGLDYLTGDLSPKSAKAMRKLDITRIDAPSDSFDVVHASHVLEHVHNDRGAMQELYRVMRPGGWGIFQVPLKWDEHTFVDPRARTPQARKRAYGQHNHVRYYGGLDYGPMLQSVGFHVDPVPFAAAWDAEQIARFRVCPHERIYFCTKRSLDR